MLLSAEEIIIRDKSEVENGTGDIYRPEVPMLRFMVEDLHSDQRAEGGSERRKDEQGELFYTPLFLFRFALVDSVEDEGDKGEYGDGEEVVFHGWSFRFDLAVFIERFNRKRTVEHSEYSSLYRVSSIFSVCLSISSHFSVSLASFRAI